MELLYLIATSMGSIAALFLLTKLMGNRQMSQMSMFDYINGITIGSIAAECATSLEGDFLKPLIAMSVYALIAIFISVATCKSMRLRKFFNGQPLVLYAHGKIYKKNLSVAKLDFNEFLTQCRVAGYFDLNELEAAVLETNGQISFLPLSEARPLTAQDIGVTLQAERLPFHVILDGEVLAPNLKASGRDEKWLQKELHALGMTDISAVFFATINTRGQLCAYARLDNAKQHNCFE